MYELVPIFVYSKTEAWNNVCRSNYNKQIRK